MAGLPSGTNLSDVPEHPPRLPRSEVVELASTRMPLLAPLHPDAPPAAPAAPRPAPDRSRPVGFTATTGDTRIPGTALAAYQRAAAGLAALSPACHLPWTLLAGIGKVESDHANGGLLAPDGTALTPIIGPELNGRGLAALPDPEASPPGSAWLRAVGPMQILPTTWKQWAVSAQPGTQPDPQNIFDAAATAGAYLCDEHRDLTDPRQLSEAVLAYNPSAVYLFDVLSWVVAYSSTDARLGSDDGWLMPGRQAQERPGKPTAPGAGTGPSGATRPGSGARPPEGSTATTAAAPPAPPVPPVPNPRPELPPPSPSPAPTCTPAPTPKPTPEPALPTAPPSPQPSPQPSPTASAPPPSAHPTASPSALPGRGDPSVPSRSSVPVPPPTRAG